MRGLRRHRTWRTPVAATAAAGVVAAAVVLGPVASPRTSSTALAAASTCGPVDMLVNTGGATKALNRFSAAGVARTSVPLARSYGDIAFSADGTTLYGVTLTPSSPPASLDVLDAVTGTVLSSTPLSGSAASQLNLNGLSSLPDGRLLLGSRDSATLHAVTPSTGVTTASGLALPSGSVSGGDFLTLDDGDVLVLGFDNFAPTGAYLVRLHPDGTRTRVGTLPESYGMTQVAGRVYIATSDGRLLVMPSAPANTTNLGPAPYTVAATTGQAFYGATSVQDSGACNTMTASSTAATFPAGTRPVLTVSGLAPSARGTVTFTTGGTALCSVVLPATSCLAPVLPPGTYTAVASLSSNGETSTTTFTVLPAPLPQVVTISAPATAPLGSRTVRATATTSGGGAITYTSSDPAVATVDASGQVVLLRPGTTTLTATASATAADLAGSASTVLEVLATPSPSLPSGSTRLGGPDRVDTSVDVSRGVFADPPSGAATDVVIATSATFADAIAGARLAGQVQGPLLLTDPDHLDADVAAEVRRLARTTGTVYLLGQQQALSSAVEADLRAQSSGYSVQRVGGADRYETAVAVAEVTTARGGGTAPLYVVDGDDFADGVCTGPLAHRTGGVLLLTHGATMPASTTAYLRQSNPSGDRTVVVGVAAAQAQVRAGFRVSTVVAGTDRYATSALLARRLAATPVTGGTGAAAGSVVPVTAVGVAGGGSWPDALAGAAAMSHLDGPLLLTPSGSTELPVWTRDVLTELGRGAERAVLFGGRDPVTDPVAAQVTSLIQR